MKKSGSGCGVGGAGEVNREFGTSCRVDSGDPGRSVLFMNAWEIGVNGETFDDEVERRARSDGEPDDGDVGVAPWLGGFPGVAERVVAGGEDVAVDGDMESCIPDSGFGDCRD